MLKHPLLNEEFIPDLMWFVGQFDVYDREETRGAMLETYNPDYEQERLELIRKYGLDLDYLSHRHKYVLLSCFKKKLDDPTVDFQSVFDIEEDCAGSWPRGEWYNLKNPKDFFKDIYLLAKEKWKEDIQKAALEDPSDWQSLFEK